MNGLLLWKKIWVFPAATVALQITGVLAMRWEILALFNPHTVLSPQRALNTSYAMLGVFGTLGTITALGGIYQLLRRARWLVALPLLLMACLPSLFLSMLYLYGLLIFGGLI